MIDHRALKDIIIVLQQILDEVKSLKEFLWEMDK